MTDIVVRLFNCGIKDKIVIDAAHEIERLRQRVAELEALHVAHVEREAEHSRKRKALQLEIAALKAGQGEPAAYIHKWKLHAATIGKSLSFRDRSPHRDDMEIIPLYTSAPTIPEGWQLVPVNVIAFYESALKASWPNGAIGDVFENWNEARKSMLAAAPKP